MGRDGHRFYEIRCSNRRKGHLCNHYLGDIQVDTQNIARHKCNNCSVLWEHEVDVDLLVHRRKILGKRRSPDMIVRIEHAS